MPELPEVETIRRQLSELIVGKKIMAVAVRDFAKKIHPADLAEQLRGQKITKIERRAKLLVLDIADGRKLLIHLKMTGQLVYRAHDGAVRAVGGQPVKADLRELPNKFTHVIVTFADGGRLFFNDVRKFGFWKLLAASDFKKILGEYGIEPLSKKFTQSTFDIILARRPRRKIKQLLMEQNLLAGVGNIYSDEGLYAAGIRPERPSGRLTATERTKLRRAIIKILKKSIAKGGTSADNYVDAWGREGGFVPFLKVYGREGQACACGGKVARVKIGGRSAHYCSKCQK